MNISKGIDWPALVIECYEHASGVRILQERACSSALDPFDEGRQIGIKPNRDRLCLHDRSGADVLPGSTAQSDYLARSLKYAGDYPPLTIAERHLTVNVKNVAHAQVGGLFYGFVSVYERKL